MSTKNTLAHGRSFHLYGDFFDRDAVWLGLCGADFDANRQNITLRIPLEIWEVIRRQTPVVFDLANKSDEEITQMARARVEDHIREFKKAKGPRRKLLAAQGWGAVRAVQVCRVKRAMILEKAWQQDLQCRIARIQTEGSSRPIGDTGSTKPPITVSCSTLPNTVRCT